MTAPPAPITPDWVETLLQQPGREEQAAFLREARLLDEEGLSQLLAFAMSLARNHPGKARQLTTLCAEMAELAHAPAILPRATYLRAQTHAINGEFEAARQLIYTAREGYTAIGEHVEALRTNVGLMHVLNELGRHQEALEAGAAVLAALASMEASEPLILVAALVQQNRGVCYETTGRYEEALEAYAAAEAHLTTLEMTERIGDISNNRGIVLLHLGRAREALGAFERAATIWAEAGLTLLQAQTMSNIGEAQLALGNYTRSLEAFEQARRLSQSLEADAHSHILLRQTADAYLLLNLFPEALAAYREVDALLSQAGMADHRARALWGLGSVLVAQGKLDEAASALDEAGALFGAAENVPMLSSVRLEQAAVQAARGAQTAALQTAQQALEMVTGSDLPVQQLYAYLRVADLLLPDTEAAEPYLLAAQALTDTLHLPQMGYRLNRRLGTLRLLQGRDEEAEHLLERAIEQIEVLRGTLAQEVLRTSFLQDKTAAYEDLMRLHLAREDEASVRRAFTIAEQAKSRTLVDLLTDVIDRQSTAPSDSELSTRLQTLQADLNATYNEFMAESGGGTREVPLPVLQERAVALEQEISRLRLTLASSGSATELFAAPLDLDALQAQLPTELVLVAYHIVGDEVLAFVRQQGRIQVCRYLTQAATIQSLLQRLNVQWDRFRVGGAFAQRHMMMLQQSTQRVLAGLYNELIAPLEPLLDLASEAGATQQVAIVPHGVLHQVPFHALHDGQQALLDRWEISYAPSVTVLALCQRRVRRRGGRAVVVGVPDALIPAVRAEAETVAQQLTEGGRETVCLVEEQATLSAISALVPGCDILHLACHGLFRADNPMFSSLKLHDGWLTAADVIQLDLTDALVTLSACESGRSQVILGDEALGLPRAFLGAGAATLVVSLWLVQDESTVTLMAAWYERLQAGLSPAAALREAQQALRHHHPHPYYWAPFVLIGQRY
ncbi:MAG: CHAT domain-containing protein [Ardenticatenales bacterium]|nr:CHAT domain-containing protein [Ardenticatenales bacterium]